MAYIEEKVETLEKKVAELEAIVQQSLSEIKPEKLYKVTDIAKMLELTPAGVNYRIRQGHLIASGGRCKKITETNLNKFMKEYFNPDQIAKH